MYAKSIVIILIIFSSNYVNCTNELITNGPECGTISNNIENEDRSKWPWHAAIYRKRPKDTNSKGSRPPIIPLTYACGGTLINRNTILTSARCVSSAHDMQLYPVELQRVILSPAGSDFLISADDANSQLFKVDSIIVHPDFDYSTMTNNIAVVKLQLEATINDYVRPICFPYNTTTDFEVTKYQLQPGRNGMEIRTLCTYRVAGFGLDLNTGNISNVLKEFDFSIESELDCFNDFRVQMKPTQFCAGYSGFTPLIKSSGGGLVFPAPQPKLQFYIQGIVCHGKYDEQSQMKFLGSKSNIVLTKVAAYIGWILQYLGPQVGDIRSNFQMPEAHSSGTSTTNTTTPTPISTTIPTTTSTSTTTTTPATATTTTTTSAPTTSTTSAPTITTNSSPSTSVISSSNSEPSTSTVTTFAPSTVIPENSITTTTPETLSSTDANSETNKPINSVVKPNTLDKNVTKCPPIVPTEDSNVAVTCVLPSETDGYSIKKNCETETFVGVRASFDCKPYYKRTVNNPFFSKICQENGEWSHKDQMFACDLDCGITDKVTEKMIVNGKPSSTRKWPWHAAIFRKTSGTFQYICGGALIQPNVVVTACHCVTDDFGGRMEPNLYQVVLGAVSSDLSENYEDLRPQVTRIKNIYTHPQYNYVNANADIALLTLKRNVKITNRVHPVCFPYSEDDTDLTDSMLSPGSYGVVAGFGFDESWKMSSTLRELQMPVVSYRDCSKVLGLQYIPTTQFCAGYVNGSSPCEGDSGGALVFPSDTIPVRYYLQGIVSYGTLAKNTKRCDNTKYTIFARVASFNSWVTDKLRDIYSTRR